MSQYTVFSFLFQHSEVWRSKVLDCFAAARNDSDLETVYKCSASQQSTYSSALQCKNTPTSLYKNSSSLQYENSLSLLYKKSPSLRAAATQSQTGFTLLEIVLVLFLISLMASATLFLTDNIDSQASYDETKRRMEIIRQAIVGDPTRRINGQTEISGFAADMGRLPECIAELIEVSTAIPSTVPQEFISPCGGASKNIKEWHIDSSTGLTSGWRGPYIQVTPESNGQLRFRDGYGNSDASDAQNSGWAYSIDASGAGSIISEGQTSDSSDDLNNTTLISSSDWLMKLPANINVEIHNLNANDLPNTNQNLVLLLYLDDLTSPIGTSEITTLSASEAIASSNVVKTFTIQPPDNISIGNRGYVIACDEWDHDSNVVTPDIYTVYTGENACLSSPTEISSDEIIAVTISPRQTPTLNWTIQ